MGRITSPVEAPCTRAGASCFADALGLGGCRSCNHAGERFRIEANVESCLGGRERVWAVHQIRAGLSGRWFFGGLSQTPQRLATDVRCSAAARAVR